MERGRAGLELSAFCVAWIAFLLALPSARGQVLQISPQTAKPGEWVTLEIRLQSPADRPVVALQWDLEIPSASLDPENRPVAVAPLAVKDAGKTATCVTSKKSAEALLVRCLVAGEQKPVPSGVVFLFSLKLSERAGPGMLRVRMQNGLAIDPNLKQTPIEPAEALVTIRAR